MYHNATQFKDWNSPLKMMIMILKMKTPVVVCLLLTLNIMM